ncbi:MAG TPA: DUF5916 domain-containing protein [Candidatus Polarisedimenticolia bacterium]|nr:DUF5916 domain-containing protein [Candidatus Polarisedimenticolia bacterium]
MNGRRGRAQLIVAAFLLGTRCTAALGRTQAEGAPGAAGPSTYTVPRVSTPVTVDGLLDEEAWRAALVVELPYEIDPGENTPAPVRTECLVAFDAAHLYVAFRAYDPNPAEIRAHLTDRDNAGGDDFVGFMVDTFNDERRGFQLFVNPLGVQMDSSRNDVGNLSEMGGESTEDPTWDAIWVSAARITPEGYVVEMAIPFTSLRFPRGEGNQTWGFFPLRSYPRQQRHQIALRPVDRNRVCTLCQAAKLVGFAGISAGRNLELDPTLTAHRTDDHDIFPTTPLETGRVAGSGGLTARWGVTPNLSLNATLNPDFSQVEADTAQLTINTRFKLFYPEKRPFFLEGADFFTTPLNVIYTRTATQPSWGAKVTGKMGPHALGLFIGEDEKTSLIFPSNQESDDNSDDPSFEQKNTVAGFRYRHDLGKSSTLGFLLTDREGEGYHNRLYSGDGLLRFTDVDTLRFQYLVSETLYPAQVAADFAQPAKPFQGSAYTLRYSRASRDWNVWGGYEDLGRDFRADTGFIPRVDTRRSEAGVERVRYGPAGARYTRLLFGVWGWRIDDHDSRLTDQDLGIHGVLLGPLQSILYARLARQKEFFEGVTYEKTGGEFLFNIRPTGDFTFGIGGRIGDAVDYDNSRAAKMLRLAPELTFDFGRHLHLKVNHTLERLDVRGGRLYEANLTQIRLVHQFTVRSFARAIVQYNDTIRDTALYIDAVEPRTSELLTQLLFSYKVNPQTLVFLGYSDNRTTEDTLDLDLTQKDRTIFFKIGYAWLM